VGAARAEYPESIPTPNYLRKIAKIVGASINANNWFP